MSQHELRLDEAANIDTAYRELPAKVRTDAIRPAVTAFAVNVDRMLAHVESICFAIGLAGFQRDLGSWVGQTYIGGQEDNDPEWLLNLQMLKGSPMEPALRILAMKRGFQTLHFWAGYHEGVATAIQQTFRSQISSPWTAIETMAGDLWEAALNAHPATLASLQGNPKRIGFQTREPTSARDDKSVALSQISKVTAGTYDLGRAMGTLLRDRFNFTRLEGIRHAYGQAFSKRSQAIDSALCDKSLDGLNALRNVLVHRAGRADQEYLSKAALFPPTPIVPVDDPILLNGTISAAMVNAAIARSVDLIQSVDEWLSAKE